MLLQQTTGPNGTGSQIDVDFAMWGPYSNLSAGCTSIMSGSAAPIQCSFSSSYSEDLGLGVSGGTGTGLTTPPAAVAGQVYIVLLTNYDGAAGYISFNQTGGTGSADCSIVDPCSIDNFTATTSACNSATNTYTVNGNITISNPPAAGQLIVQACDGTQTVVASAPFGATTYPYSITGLNANGAACDVEVFFTNESCSQILNYTAPTCPPVCSFTNINGNIGACQQGSTFNLTGTLDFVSPPATGQLIVEDCNGNSVAYNAPFTSPLNFAINGIDADGQPCTATAHFTANPTCSISVSYTNTPSCECTVDIGTFSTTIAGESTSTYVLCYGDEILIEPNGDYTPPGEALNPPLAEGYEPGIAWIMYSCPPTVAVTPDATNGIGDDPCFIGIVSPTDLYDVNDLYWINGYPGTFTNNTVYFVPITMYNLTEYYYSYVNGGLPCYEMGTPYAIQYLPEITTTVTPNCQAGTVSVTVQGGSPAINGTNFTASNLQPATASLASNTVANNGTFVISGLQNGDNYSLDITDEFGCPVTITGTFQGVTPSGFTYPQSAYCKGSANPTPTITGASGGTFTGTSGLVINAATGLINIASTPAGNYVVTYTSPGAPCNSSSTFNITINPLPVITAPNVSVCNGQAANLTASGADTYSWSPATGLNTTTGSNVVATLIASQTYTITGTNTTTGCVNTGTVTVTVNPLPNVNAGNDVAICLGASTTLTASGASTYNWNNGLGAGASHSVSPTVTTIYEVTGTTAFGCVRTDQVTVTVNPVPVVNAGADVAICVGTSTTLTASGANTYTWDNGLGAGTSHTVSPTVTTTYTVTGTDINGCTDTDQVIVTVNPLPAVNAGPDVAICQGGSTTLTASGANTYVWNNGLGAGISHTVSPTATTTYTVTGTDANGCVNTDQVIVTVNPNPNPVITGQTEYCAGTPATVQTSQTYTTYNWSNGQTTPSISVTEADNPIQVTVTNAFGCSGTSAVHAVTENTVITTSNTIEICQGQSVIIHGIVRTTAGLYSNTAPSVNGCDSTSNINLIVHMLPAINAGVDAAICIGSSTTISASGGSTYTWSNGLGTGSSHVVSPTNTTTYTVTGTDVNGCVNTDQVVVTVNALPVINAGADVAICIGSSTTISASGGSTYYWNQGLGTGASHTVSPTSTTTYTVTGTDVNGCVSTDQVVVTVNALPIINAGQDVDICIGSSTTISASGGSTYNWNQGLGNGASHTVSPTSTTTYTVTGTDVNGCVNSDNVNVTVNPLPIIDAGQDQQVCEGEPVTLNATGAPTLVWNPSQTNGTPFVQPVGNQIYTVTGTDANGCVNTDQMQVTVLANPVITQVPNQTICKNATFSGVNLTSSIPGATFNWTSSNGTIGLPVSGNGNIGSFTAMNNTSSAVTSTITVVATANGCFGDPMTFTITVQPSPTASISGTAAVCIGGPSPQVTFTGGTGTAPYTIAYNINGGMTQTVTTTGNTATVNAPTATAGMYVYNLTSVTESGNTCSAPANGSVTITVNALPIINAGNDVAVCQNGQITLMATGAGTNGTYSWTPAATNGVPFVPPSSATYTVTGTDANGCINTDNLNVTVNPAQNVDAGPNQEVCIGEQVTLSGSPTGTGATFLWTGGITNGVAFTPNQSGTYTVTSTDVNGCNSTDQVDVIVHSLPIIEAGSNISGCEGDQYTLVGSGAGPNGTYVWNNGVQNGVAFTPTTSIGSYVVVGTDQNGCSNSDSILAKIEAIPVISFYADIDQNCVPASVTFYNTTTDPAVNCIWNFDDGSTITGCGPVTHVFQYAGTYGASLQVETPINGCPASLYQSAMVTVDANPVAHFTPNPAIGTQVNNQISFTNQSYGASSYYWEFGDGIGTSTAVNPVYTYGEEADLYTVMLIAYSNAGCVDTAYSLVTIQEELIFYVPNTFTPDLDQYNEVFKPIFTYGYNPYDYTLMIFNRWGEMIFESHDASIGWDGTYGVGGTICQDGTYTWKIEVKTTSSDERKMFTGHVNIIR